MGQLIKKKPKLKETLIVVFFFFACFLAITGSPESIDHAASGYWWSILPPLIAVCLAIQTGKIFPSLGAAVLVGGLLATVPQDPGSIRAWGQGVVESAQFIWGSASDSFNLQILAFVVVIMMMISVLLRSGGLHGIVKWISQYATTARSSQFATALMGVILFIDDYANTMIVGSSMRPVMDRHRVSREKLTFIVDATAAPITGIAFISTWIGYLVGLLNETGKSLNLSASGYQLFIDSLPFRFYCFLMLGFVFINIWRNKDFGPMADAEIRATKTGAVFAKDAQLLTSSEMANSGPHSSSRVLARTALVPFGVLVAALFGGLWFDGGGMVFFQESLFSFFNPFVWRDVLIASENNVLVLALGSFAGLIVAIFFSVQTARTPWKVIRRALFAGLQAAVIPCVVLIFAWSLKAACDANLTGKFLVAAVDGVFSPFWYPAVIFILAGLTAFSTGTSWGTMAILIPTAIPIAYQLDGASYSLTFILCLAAILDGAILGDHCSPISDTTIMSSIGSGCDHIAHVRTQLPYALLVGFFSLVFGYIPAAMGMPVTVGYLLGFAGILFVFAYFGRSTRKG